jgi:hypothetical protein
MQISPGSPCGISRAGSSSERIEMNVAGSGWPIEFFFSMPPKGLQVATGEVSDSP